jgi:hypothetical protein
VSHLTLKRGKFSRSSGEWEDEDYAAAKSGLGGFALGQKR